MGKAAAISNYLKREQAAFDKATTRLLSTFK